METEEGLKIKYNPEGSILRKAQLRMLDILLYIDEICKENQIEYWLSDGTLLGAIRHHGFIPWDDDVDICMRRKDYSRFKNIIEESSNNQFVLQDHYSDNRYYNYWGVMRDLKSEYLQNNLIHKARKFRGLQVDIFLVDNNIIPFLRFFSSGIFWLNHQITSRFSNKFIYFTANGIWHIGANFVFPILRFISSFKFDKSNLRFSYGIPFYYTLREKDVFPLSNASFEGHMFPVPHNSIACLRQIYGNDYNSLPPESERQGHDTQIIFF